MVAALNPFHRLCTAAVATGLCVFVFVLLCCLSTVSLEDTDSVGVVPYLLPPRRQPGGQLRNRAEIC